MEVWAPTWTWDLHLGRWRKIYWRVEGVKHGKGTLFFSDGTKITGESREDEPWKITVFDKDGNIIIKMLDGVEQKVIYLKPPPSSPTSNPH